MYQALIIVHVLLAVGIISLVMLQQGKGADAGAAFGSGASGTVFGAQGSANFLSRATAVLATLFFATSLGLAMVGETRESSSGFMDLPPVESPVSDMPSGQTKTNPAPAVSDVPSAQPGSAKVQTDPESGKAAKDAPSQAVTPEAQGAPQSPAAPPVELETPEAAAPVESEPATSTAAAPEALAPPAPVQNESANGAPAARETPVKSQ